MTHALIYVYFTPSCAKAVEGGLQGLMYKHGGARPPPVCVHRAWVDFFKMALKKSAKAYGFCHIGF